MWRQPQDREGLLRFDPEELAAGVDALRCERRVEGLLDTCRVLDPTCEDEFERHGHPSRVEAIETLLSVLLRRSTDLHQPRHGGVR